MTPETLFPIERIQAPTLMLSSKHDEVWPSFESGSYIEEKLTAHGMEVSPIESPVPYAYVRFFVKVPAGVSV